MPGRAIMRVAALAAAVAVCALLAAAPAGAKTFRGSTGQGRSVAVKLAGTRTLKSFSIHWKARCRGDRHRWRDATTVTPRTGRTVTLPVRAVNTYTVHQGSFSGQYRIRFRARRTSIYRIVGGFKAHLVIRHRNKVLARCAMRTTRFRASIPQFAIHLNPAPGHYIVSQGLDVRSPSGHASFGIGPTRDVRASFAGYTLEIGAGNRRKLHKGRYANAIRFPFNERGPGVDIYGNGRGCNEVKGEFTINSISYRRGKLQSINFTFVHQCEGGGPALTGSVFYRR